MEDKDYQNPGRPEIQHAGIMEHNRDLQKAGILVDNNVHTDLSSIIEERKVRILGQIPI